MRDYKNVPETKAATTVTRDQYNDMVNTELAKGQFKLDTGKTPINRGLFQYFPRALKAVAEVSLYGFEKYKEWGGWKKLYDASNRYEDALARHQLDMAKGEKFDAESGLWHIKHRAWNALATLELALIELESQMIKPDPKPSWAHDNRLPVREQMDPTPVGLGQSVICPPGYSYDGKCCRPFSTGDGGSGVTGATPASVKQTAVDSRDWTGDLPTREDYPR